MSGQGSMIGSRLEELKEIRNNISKVKNGERKLKPCVVLMTF